MAEKEKNNNGVYLNPDGNNIPEMFGISEKRSEEIIRICRIGMLDAKNIGELFCASIPQCKNSQEAIYAVHCCNQIFRFENQHPISQVMEAISLMRQS